MDWKATTNTVATVIICAILSGIVVHYSDPQHSGSLMAAIAVTAATNLINHLRQSPRRRRKERSQ